MLSQKPSRDSRAGATRRRDRCEPSNSDVPGALIATGEDLTAFIPRGSGPVTATFPVLGRTSIAAAYLRDYVPMGIRCAVGSECTVWERRQLDLVHTVARLCVRPG
jgi:hypothetical protein